MISNTNVLIQPQRKARVEQGETIAKLVNIKPQYGVLWFNNPKANIVDISLELPDGYIITQRETLSFSYTSNFGKLIRAAMKIPENEFIYEIKLDEIIGKEVIGDVIYWKNRNNDTYEKVKNFRPIDSEEEIPSVE